jgi:hypothetical protein
VHPGDERLFEAWSQACLMDHRAVTPFMAHCFALETLELVCPQAWDKAYEYDYIF